jgi:hypothetical protein
MNNILNVNKETSTEIEFIVNDGRLVSSKSVFGDESPLLLEVLFNDIKTKKLIPLSYMEGKVKMTLTEGGEEDGVPFLDILFYRDDEQDEDETPILWLTELFIYEIKSTLRFEYLNSLLDEIFDNVIIHLNSIECKEGMKDDLKTLGIEIDFVDMSRTKKYGDLEMLKYSIDNTSTIEDIMSDMVIK